MKPIIRSINTELEILDDEVCDLGTGESNEDLQKLIHILAKLPDQYAGLVIEYELIPGELGNHGWDDPPGSYDEPPQWFFHDVYLIPRLPNIRAHEAPHIKIRPTIARALYERYQNDIEKDAEDEMQTRERPYDDIQRLADAITEDPDIFTPGQ